MKKNKTKKNPFENCGTQIKSFIGKIYKLLMLLSIVAGGGLLIAGISEGGPEEAIFWIGLAMLIVLPVLVHISCLFLYGYGEIVENAEKQMSDAGAEKSGAIDEIPTL